MRYKNGSPEINFNLHQPWRSCPFREKRQTINVVLLNVKISAVNGEETCRVVWQIQPDLKIIFTSGYHESEIAGEISGSAHVSGSPLHPGCITRQIGHIRSRG